MLKRVSSTEWYALDREKNKRFKKGKAGNHMASIRDVARLAGVSPSTVSRVMNGTANVNDEKVKRVQQAIQETGFRPNELARMLYRKSSNIIGVIVPNIENPFFSEIARSIEEESYKHGYRILLCSSNDDTEKEQINIQMLVRMKADGIILMTNSTTRDYANIIVDVPVVVVDRRVVMGNEVAYIQADHYEGGRLALKHLVECGCRSIVCMRGPLELTSGRDRYRGYEAAAKENGIRIQVVDAGYSFKDGDEATEILLREYPDVDGIIAPNDMVALSVYKNLFRRGIRVPQDIQLIGFDDIPLAELLTPELTTIEQPIRTMGRMAVEIIVKNSEGEPFEKDNILPVKLVRRETTGCLTEMK